MRRTFISAARRLLSERAQALRGAHLLEKAPRSLPSGFGRYAVTTGIRTRDPSERTDRNPSRRAADPGRGGSWKRLWISRHENPRRSMPSGVSGVPFELRQFRVSSPELFVEMRVAVVPHVADQGGAELDHHTSALVEDVLGRALEPASFADLDDRTLVRVVPVAGHGLVLPVRGAQSELSVGEGAQHRIAPVPLASDGR